jgi:surfeit locus 1 family protein
VSLTGTYDSTHQFLIDNMSYNDVDGYQVLTPFERPGAATVLVDRGWVPFLGSRAQLPDISIKSTGPMTISGRVGNLPVAGLAIGRAPPPDNGPWPRVTSFPSMAQLSGVLHQPLEPRVILLDPQQPEGYVRDWHPPGIPAMQNFAYAFEWWSFAIAALVMWVVLGTQKPKEGA